jgi:formylglycine-generating enzyme required for sulfatase activity
VEEWSREHQAGEADWRAAVLAGEQLLEIGLAAVGVSEGHRVIRRRVAGWLEALLNQGALPVAERDQAGGVLARLGDQRKGVGLKNGLPDVDWIEILPGPFRMDNDKGQTPYEQETPQFACDVIRQPYGISRYSITVAQYQAFVDAGGYGEERFWTKAGWQWRQSKRIAGPEDYDPVFQTPNHPRVGVSWYEALAFCRWLSERLDRVVTLPSEPEWERAARHTDGRKFPWGDQELDIGQRCNILETGLGRTSAVGMFPSGLAKSRAADMAGNVWEWTRSLWGEDWGKSSSNYPYVLDAKRENPDAPGKILRVLRGGSWLFPADYARCACRLRGVPDGRSGRFGFRVVASPFFALSSQCSAL